MEEHIKDITEKESIVKSTTLAFFVLAQLVILGGIIAVVISSEPVGMRLTKQLGNATHPPQLSLLSFL